ncbi:MAG TPA: hypothetical protein VFE58_19030 [Tepidisphaeraceae bacterium]|nr:hypothetical protein [Tepidisphaeraceae bacterium]
MFLSSYAVQREFLIGHIDTSQRYRVCELLVGAGLIEFQYGGGVDPSTVSLGWHYDVYRGPPASFRDILHNLWTFGAGPLGPPIRYDLGFPAWLLALACTIAPLLWLRRRRRINRRGFPIEPSEPPQIADATAPQE